MFPLLLPAETFDVILRGGRVIDGMGNPAFFADVGIKDGRVAALGKIQGDARVELNVKGLIIAPGFIDVHTHGENAEKYPLTENFVRMGVTTIIAGNCGSSVLNVRNFFQRLETNKVSVNVATLIGHGTVRKNAMGGSFNRPPTDAELEKMKALVDQAMKAGAVGLSTGLIYLPGEFAKTDEIIELAKVVSQYDGVYASHMRGEGSNIFRSLDELFTIARQGGLRAEISHIKLSGPAAWGMADKVLAAIDSARAQGLDITEDQYLYTASSTGFSQTIPEQYCEGGKFKENLADPAAKSRMIADMRARLKRSRRKDYSYAVIADYQHDRSLNGLSIAQAAKKARGSDDLQDQIELLLEIESHGGASGIFHGINEQDLQQFLSNPNTMLGSDSSVRPFQEGVPHPRGYGNNARFLAHYVRELKLMRLEEAVHRMTSLPASVFRLKDRGTIREGAWADLAVFDPAVVQDNSTFADPHHYATGFAYVLVNGVVVVEKDKHTGARPGRPLRHQVP